MTSFFFIILLYEATPFSCLCQNLKPTECRIQLIIHCSFKQIKLIIIYVPTRGMCLCVQIVCTEINSKWELSVPLGKDFKNKLDFENVLKINFQ